MARWDSKKTRKHRPQWKCVSIHDYWDPIHETNDFANYEACMVYTEHVEDSVKKVRGLLETLGLEKKIKIA